MEEFATMSFCEVPVFDYDTVDGIDGHFQYNNVQFHLDKYKHLNGTCVEVFEDWKIIIWVDDVAGTEFYIMEDEEFREKLYKKYPLKG